ncbi:hypothetical protein G6F63_016392 [Rhizopus arrhizus]|nr:hypothetical protein G6F63_016392 [Rhizopus arrhizus]
MGRPQSLGGSGEAARIDDGTQRAQGGELIHQRAAPVGRTRDGRAQPAYEEPPPAGRPGRAAGSVRQWPADLRHLLRHADPGRAAGRCHRSR